MSENGYEIKATRTTLDLVVALDDLGQASLTELAEHVGIPKSTAHIHLSTLRDRNFVAREGNDYRLGLRLLAFGHGVREAIPLYAKAKPQVDAVARETGELTNLMVEENGLGRYVYSAIENEELDLEPVPGSRAPLHATGLGKAILAHTDEERVREIVDRRGLAAETEHTITDLEALFEELATVEERGLSFDREEYMRGVECIAIPLVSEGEALGALSVAGPTSRMRDEAFRQDVIGHLRNAKNVIELNVAYS